MNFIEAVRQNIDRSRLEEWCRQRTQRAVTGPHEMLCRVLGTYLMYVDPSDQSIAPHLMMDGFWEMWVTQAICHYVRPGMKCIDAGANFGYYTVLLADLVGEKGRVWGFEPRDEVWALLEKTRVVNGFTQARTDFRAVSNHSGEGILTRPRDHFGASSLLGIGHELIRVGTTSIDDFMQAPSDEQPTWACSPLDFVKIDVQGAELLVLEGMANTIQSQTKIALAMELTPSEHSSAALREGFTLMRELGLSLGTIGHDGVVREITEDAAVKPDTGDHRMLWLEKGRGHRG